MRRPRTAAQRVFDSDDASLLDVVDNALKKGVVLTGELTLSLANVDLVYVRLSLLLAAADRILPHESDHLLVRRQERAIARRLRAARAARLVEQQASDAGGTETTRTETTRTRTPRTTRAPRTR